MALTGREKAARRREKMKSQHRCIACGRQDERTLRGLVKCGVCAQKDKDSYHKQREANPDKVQEKNANKQVWRGMLREKHMCVDCKRQDALTLMGRLRCAECAARNAERKRAWRSENPDRCDAENARFRERYEDEHRCVHCGHPLPFDCSYKTCQRCREIGKQQKEARRWAENPNRFKRGAPGICWMCVKRPVMEGKRMCRECYEQRLPIALKNIRRAQANNGKHVWRRLNDTVGGKTPTQGRNA